MLENGSLGPGRVTRTAGPWARIRTGFMIKNNYKFRAKLENACRFLEKERVARFFGGSGGTGSWGGETTIPVGRDGGRVGPKAGSPRPGPIAIIRLSFRASFLFESLLRP